MDIGWFRDLAICISGLVITVVVIFAAVLVYLLYSRVKSVLNSLEATSSTINEITLAVRDEVVKPVTQVVALVQGIMQGIDVVSRLFKKKEGGKDD